MKVTAENIVKAVNDLPRNVALDYPSETSTTQIQILEVTLPEGPIIFRRWDPSHGESFETAPRERIGSNMIRQLADAVVEEVPIDVEALYHGSYNTRSAFEAILAYTPFFYMCKPLKLKNKGRGKYVTTSTVKHLVYRPRRPHRFDDDHWTSDFDDVLASSVVAPSIEFDALSISVDNPNDLKDGNLVKHCQVQAELYEIGKHLGCDVYIAKGDVKKIAREGFDPELIRDLQDVSFLAGYSGAVKSGRMIDCIWFKDDNNIPAVFEVEHTTTINSGLDRMLNLRNCIPGHDSCFYVIVADDSQRERVFNKAGEKAYDALRPFYLSYSAVERFYSLCKTCTKEKLVGVDVSFLRNFLESIPSKSGTDRRAAVLERM